MAQHNELGKKGEQIAIDYLIDKGYTILDKNWRFQKAEVDVIAQKNELIIAVEVKTRTSDYFGDPQDFISKKKISLLVLAMNEYVLSKNFDNEIRFDVIAILKNKQTFKIEHIEDAFLYF
ncbi:YraN family protein [Urechidicola vernalis]|uniref:UPF0102 protein RM519_10950 n=1 Tax=Urechidicola vernalis TaxID=3075600 RepID=A0ABU2Y924_9FLAO|nr:YraN family protein [Urechidicola sp. P050]MDT0553765.1 YraN family protein [Urechidicola sp. P050]